MENFDYEDFERTPVHPFLRPVIRSWSLKDFLRQQVSIRECTKLLYHTKLFEWPSFEFMDYDGNKEVVVNVKCLSYFEMLKYCDYLEVKEVDCCYLLNGKLPEDFYYDKAVRERWKDCAEAADKRWQNSRNRIPDAEIGR